MRGRGTHRAADVPDAVHGDLARAARELLEDVRAGAQRERVGPADVASGERDGLLDEVLPRGVGVAVVPITAENVRTSRPLR